MSAVRGRLGSGELLDPVRDVGQSATSCSRSPRTKSCQSKPGDTTVETRLHGPSVDEPCHQLAGTWNCGWAPGQRIGADHDLLCDAFRVDQQHPQRRTRVVEIDLVARQPMHRREVAADQHEQDCGSPAAGEGPAGTARPQRGSSSRSSAAANASPAAIPSSMVPVSASHRAVRHPGTQPTSTGTAASADARS